MTTKAQRADFVGLFQQRVFEFHPASAGMQFKEVGGHDFWPFCQQLADVPGIDDGRYHPVDDLARARGVE